MKSRRLRDRLGGAIGLLLVALIASTTALVGVKSYQGYSYQLRESLAQAPAEFLKMLQPHFLAYSFSGEQFGQDGEIRLWRANEKLYRDKAGSEADYEASFYTLADEASSFVTSEQGAELLMLVDVPSPDKARTVIELRRPWVDPELGRKQLELPRWLLDVALGELKPRLDYLLVDGELYMLTLVPLTTSVSETHKVANGLVVQGYKLSNLPAPAGCTMVLAARTPGGLKILSGVESSSSGEPIPVSPDWLETLASRLSERTTELFAGPKHYLVNSLPLGQAGQVFFLRDLGWVRAQVAGLMVSVGALGILALGAGLLLSRRLAAAVTRPIERLADQMERVGRGDLEQQAVVEGQDEVAQLAAAFNHMTGGLREREAFRKLAPEGARREIEKDSQIKLGGEWIEATIMFSDLRGFTSMSEKLSPTAVVELLNEYLQDMSLALKAHHGDINEYIGDAILAVFHDREGVPSSVLAVRAALDMQASLERLRQKTENETLKKIKMGVGLHTGDLVEGWIGAEDRVKYGVVGDTVNLAARIQDRSRDGKHTFILVSGATRERLGDHFELDFFGDETFKGKTGTTPVWEVVREKAPRAAP
ncbi:MAG: hypothetical protein AMXMBFR33_41500 [Candidatus Xenobia bacterium]